MPAPTDEGERSAELLEHTDRFYQQLLQCNQEARIYLAARGIHDPAIIERMRIGYAPGACLRAHLARLGHTRRAMVERGLARRKKHGYSTCIRQNFYRTGEPIQKEDRRNRWRRRSPIKWRGEGEAGTNGTGRLSACYHFDNSIL
jgi:DNA primase catalytic core, N-terminal domain